MSNEPIGKTTVFITIATLVGTTMAMMETSAMLASGGIPVVSPFDLLVIMTWLGLAYGGLLGLLSIAGAMAITPLIPGGKNQRFHVIRAVFGGIAVSLAILFWLRSITRLGERAAIGPVLAFVVFLGAVSAGVTVAALIKQLSARGTLWHGGLVWISLLAGFAALIIASRPRSGPFGQTGPPPGLPMRMLIGAAVVAVFFMTLRLIARGGNPFGWTARVVTGGLLVWTIFCAHDFSRFATRVGEVKAVENGGALAAGGNMVGSRPNVLLVSIDTLRADRVSSYGHDRPTTPRLDELAAGGVRFDKTAATSSFTTPTHASMMTGLFPVTHGAVYQRADPSRFVINPMLPGIPTLAGILQAKGYDTAGFVASPMVGSQFGFDRGFKHFDDDYSRLKSSRGQVFSHTLMFRLMFRAGLFKEGDSDAERTAEEVNERVLNWLSERDEESRHPFFLFVHYYDPHAPYDPEEGHDMGLDLDRSMAILDMPSLLDRDYTLTPKSWQSVLDLYDAEIHSTDARLGELIDRLDQAGELDNTVIVVTSDHGESFGEHGHWGHNMFLYEDLLRVPFIVRLPGGNSAGVVVEDVIAQHTDIVPTVLSQVGVEIPDGIQGKDLSPWMTGSSDNEAGLGAPGVAFASLQRDFAWSKIGVYLDRDLTTVRAEGWKYIRSSNGVEELFDLTADPAEMKNLWKENKEMLQAMRDLLDSWEATQVPGDGTREGNIDEGVIENLRSLGYVQ